MGEVAAMKNSCIRIESALRGLQGTDHPPEGTSLQRIDSWANM